VGEGKKASYVPPHISASPRILKVASKGGPELSKTSEEVWQMRENPRNRACVCALVSMSKMHRRPKRWREESGGEEQRTEVERIQLLYV
jgi:hypothetical protein